MPSRDGSSRVVTAQLKLCPPGRCGVGRMLDSAACAEHDHTCGKPLLARYDVQAAARTLTREALGARPATMWRYAEVLPGGALVSLRKGITPLLHARLGRLTPPQPLFPTLAMQRQTVEKTRKIRNRWPLRWGSMNCEV